MFCVTRESRKQSPSKQHITLILVNLLRGEACDINFEGRDDMVSEHDSSIPRTFADVFFCFSYLPRVARRGIAKQLKRHATVFRQVCGVLACCHAFALLYIRRKQSAVHILVA